MPKLVKPLLIGLSLIILAGCANIPKNDVDATSQARAALPTLPDTWSSDRELASKVASNWIAKLNDPVLSGYVTEAFKNNLSIKSAAANVDRARAEFGLVRTSLAPQVNAGLSGGKEGLIEGGNTAVFNIGVTASWEADLWGRLKSRSNKAENSLAAIEADFKGTENLLAASVAQAYYLIIEAGSQTQIAQELVDSLQEVERIVKVRADNGAASPQDLAISRTDLATAKEQLVTVRGAKRNALRAMELLLGRYPSADVEITGQLVDVPGPPMAGLPSTLLERRPDIVAAERRVAAALYALDEAKTAKLPRLKLSGEFGGASSDLSDLLSPSNLAWKAASSLLMPIFNGGALDREVDIASSDVSGAVAAYGDIALSAFSEVETALDQSKTLMQRFDLLMSAKKQASAALDVANARYKAGETDLLDVLIIQQRSYAIESNLVSLKRSELDQFIALNLALGGGW